MEHMVINVEAQIARRIHDEGQTHAERADALLAEAREKAEAAEQTTDPLERVELQAEVRALLLEERRARGNANGAFKAARLAVARAQSLDTKDDPPAKLQPVVRVKLTKAEIAEREKESTASAWAGLRAERAQLLAASDWTQQPDAPVDQAAWRKYRQQLRDLPAKTKDPNEPNWPTPPKAGGST